MYNFDLFYEKVLIKSQKYKNVYFTKENYEDNFNNCILAVIKKFGKEYDYEKLDVEKYFWGCAKYIKYKEHKNFKENVKNKSLDNENIFLEIEDRINIEKTIENKIIIEKCKENLKEKEKILFELIFIGYKNNEIAKILKTSENNIAVKKNRLFKKIRCNIL